MNSSYGVVVSTSSGIGRETALEFAHRGAAVVAAARNREALETLAAEIQRIASRDR